MRVKFATLIRIHPIADRTRARRRPRSADGEDIDNEHEHDDDEGGFAGFHPPSRLTLRPPKRQT
jgi:hypothetical protein